MTEQGRKKAMTKAALNVIGAMVHSQTLLPFAGRTEMEGSSFYVCGAQRCRY